MYNVLKMQWISLSNIQNAYLGVFSYMHSHLATQVFNILILLGWLGHKWSYVVHICNTQVCVKKYKFCYEDLSINMDWSGWESVWISPRFPSNFTGYILFSSVSSESWKRPSPPITSSQPQNNHSLHSRHNFFSRNSVINNLQSICYVRGDADKFLARPTSQCHRMELIVSLERGVCSCAELQFSCYRNWKEACHVTRTISIPPSARQGTKRNSRHFDRNIRGTCTIKCHHQKLGGPV
jgi:hypothetical protein